MAQHGRAQVKQSLHSNWVYFMPWHENRLAIKLMLCCNFPCLLLVSLNLTFHFFIRPLISPFFQISSFLVSCRSFLSILCQRNHERITRFFTEVPQILSSLVLLLHSDFKGQIFVLEETLFSQVQEVASEHRSCDQDIKVDVLHVTEKKLYCFVLGSCCALLFPLIMSHSSLIFIYIYIYIF